MTGLRIKPRGEPRRAQTPAQRAATERAFRIFRLRGLYYQALLLTGERREQAQAAVDAELALLGATTQADRQLAEAAKRARTAIADLIEAIAGPEDAAEVELPF